jgi:hypothetical protein
MGGVSFLVGPNPETLSTSASIPMSGLIFFAHLSWSFAGYDGKNFKFQYGEGRRFSYGTNEPKAFTSFLSAMRHGSIVEFLCNDIRTSAPSNTIVHSHQILHTSAMDRFPSFTLGLFRPTESLCIVWLGTAIPVGSPPKLGAACSKRDV